MFNQQINSGIQFLDTNFQGWEWRIDIGRLNMADPINDLGTQLTNNPFRFIAVVRGGGYELEELGFFISKDNKPWQEVARLYSLLTLEWVEAVAARRYRQKIA